MDGASGHKNEQQKDDDTDNKIKTTSSKRFQAVPPLDWSIKKLLQRHNL
jgi:hypothetical protein